jgi:hypothetical protein
MNKRLLLSLLLIIGLSIFGCKSSNNDSSRNTATLDLAGSKQGQAVGFADVDGDGIGDKIVGAPYAATSTNVGAVLVYKGNASGYSSVPNQVLLGDDNLGYSIVSLEDVDGDGKAEFAVGAIHGIGDDVSLSGSVTIYKGGGSGQIVKRLSGEGSMDKFGYSLAAGDLNGDSRPDLAVGAPFNTNDPALYQSGAVYVYFGPDYDAPVALYATSANKGIALAVASGDVNSDGVSDLLVSASGKVLVYFGGASFAPLVNAPDITITGSASGFGSAIAVIGDQIAIGAPKAVINNNRDTGSVYIVSGASTGTVNVGASTPPPGLIVRIDGEGPFNRFGSAIAHMGDVDADGKQDFAVGAPMADVTTSAGQNILSGKVYLFKGKDIGASATIASAAAFEGAIKNQAYGTALAAGNGRLLIGAPRSNANTGGADMVDPSTGHAVPGGSSGGTTGGSGDCH